MDQQNIAAVVVNRRVTAVDKIFHYLIPERLNELAVLGAIVSVPFGREILEGVIVDRTDKTDREK